MKQKTILHETNDNHLEILKGFHQVLNFFKKIKVPEEITEIIENEVKQAYYKHGNFDFPFMLLPDNILNVDGTEIDLYPRGLNSGSSPFDISSFYNSDGFQFEGFTSTLNNSNDPTLMAIGTGLQLLDGTGLDFQTNINNVLTYGLSSWGATTTPEGIKGKIDELGAYVSSILSQNDPVNALTLFNKQLKRLLTYYKHIRANHARAGSTKKAYDLMISAINDYLKIESELASKLRTSNYNLSVNQETALGVENIFTDTSGHTVGTDGHNENNPFKTAYN
ncbi:MAG: hypothetical protein JKY69_03605, partial [Flavobacteriaceae bacterium]|nr:hypothetical protein [Flavobacteriaceae bacterium]